MSSKDVLEQALKLKPAEKFMVVEGLIKTLDEPVYPIEEIFNGE